MTGTATEGSTRSKSFSLDYSHLLVSIATAFTVLGTLRFSQSFKRLRTADCVGRDRLNGLSTIKGVVTSVGDADNFRFFHTPFFQSSIPTKKDLLGETLHIRIAGVDAPEMAHFGKAAQPYSTEAYNWLKKEILHRKLHVQLYSKDRFGRIVSMVYYKKFPYLKKLNLSEEMLRNGFATTYTQKGAVHAGLLEKFMKIEAKAQKDRKGMWQQAAKNYESPADYKQRIGKS